MDFPIVFFDHIGMPSLVALIAVTHVLINHPMAVGAYPLIVWLDYRATKQQDAELDALLHRITRVFFIVTTTIGAMTGVGIWVITSLASPYGIGSLLRIFFWAWAIEWVVFIIEISLILLYYLKWRPVDSPRKKQHLRIGLLLSLNSWLTMVIITAILGFMTLPQAEPGIWKPSGLFAAMGNPLYLPQLVFRTGFAMVSAGLAVWFFTVCFTRRQPDLRGRVVHAVALWVLVWLPVCLAGGIWHWKEIPETMRNLAPVALGTAKYAHWYGRILLSLGLALLAILAVGLWGRLRPRSVPAAVLLVPFLLSMMLLGMFERAREFIRKPYVIGQYLYANGIRASALPVYQNEGLLAHATYVRHRTIDANNRLEAGEDLFMITCSGCHTTTGINGVLSKLESRLGPGPWPNDRLENFIARMHVAGPYMPPFPGTETELQALAAYLQALRADPKTLHGAQARGARLPFADKKGTAR